MNLIPAGEFRPHLSLMYGGHKDSIKSDVLKFVEESGALKDLYFDELSLIAVDGTPSGFEVLKTFPFKNIPL